MNFEIKLIVRSYEHLSIIKKKNNFLLFSGGWVKFLLFKILILINNKKLTWWTGWSQLKRI